MSLTTIQTPTQNIYEEKFLTEYQRLNEKQKEAVDIIQGPVLVVAGPGTGKTTMLTLRVANLLRSTDDQIDPQNILCLTYTDNAATEMHKRLLSLIGPASHRVKICTFHAFCNDVIQANPQYFGKRELQAITELERKQMIEKMLDELPVTHSFKRLKGDLKYDMRRLENLFSFMKKEDLSADEMRSSIKEYVDSIPTRNEFIYQVSRKNSFTKGDLKKTDVEKAMRQMNELLDGVELFEVFTEAMRKAGRYDFDDMILWVINAFRNYPDLVAPYKEQYRYVLVDEFQDTSGAQNEILHLLTDDEIDNNPNIFCVGDDDQSIYEFQGARIKNIVDFYNKYKANIKVVVLTENYRSTQSLLDLSGALISNNKQRLVNEIPDIDKILQAESEERKTSTALPVILEFQTTEQEEAWIAAKVKALLHQGVDVKDISILYYRHRQAASLIEFFAKSDIPFTVKSELNVLDHPLVNQLVTILQYLYDEQKQPGYADDMLFEILHYNFLGIVANDLVAMAIYMKPLKDLTWREAINSDYHLLQMKLKKPEAIKSLTQKLNVWNSDILNLPLRMLAEKVLNESNLLAYTLQKPDSMELIVTLNTFFSFIEDQTSRQARMALQQLNETVQQMRNYNISLPIEKPMINRNGVTFTTCHSAKGSEYLYVFILGATKNMWDDASGNNNNFRLPPTIIYSESESSLEETNRRLFYVACTRAKENLFITYSTSGNSKKTQQSSRYISETSVTINPTLCEENDVKEYMIHKMLSKPTVQLSHKDILQERVNQMVLTQSNLNTFLKCPVEFYFRCVLDVPFGKHEGMFYGSAVHYALQKAFEDMAKHPAKQFPSTERFLEYFTLCLKRDKPHFNEKDFEKRLALGLKVLPDYYNTRIKEWIKNASVEVKIERVEMDGVPIGGRIDKIEIGEDGNAAIVDYKTDTWSYNIQNKMKGVSDDEPNGGSYWRQMLFYKILLDHQPHRNLRVTTAYFEYVEKDKQSSKYVRKEIDLDDESIELVKEQIRQVYQKIKKLEFSTGCGEEDCQWCNLMKVKNE